MRSAIIIFAVFCGVQLSESLRLSISHQRGIEDEIDFSATLPDETLWMPSLEDDYSDSDDEITNDFISAKVVQWNAAHGLSKNLIKQSTESTVKHVKPVWFHHLHQCGGTFMRFAAEAFGERPLSPHSPNFNHQGKGDTCVTPMSCKDKHSQMVAQGATYTATERSFLETSEYCPGLFNYAISISNPQRYVHRSLAHLHINDNEIPQLINILSGKTANKESLLKDSKCWATSSHKLEGQYPQFDNFIIRSLLGHDTFWLPPGAINESHLVLAKAIIEKFDIILVTDEMKSHFPQLEKYLGWSLAQLNEMTHKNSHVGDRKSVV